MTKFNATSSSNGTAGVFGNDVSSSSTFNAGTSGSSVRGFGVMGKSTSGFGVLGFSTSGVGVQGTSPNFTGINAYGGVQTNCSPERGCTDSYPALSIVGIPACCSGVWNDIIDACQGGPRVCDANHAVFSVTNLGGVVAPQFGSVGGVVSLSNYCACFSTILVADSVSVGSYVQPGTGNIFADGNVDILGQYQKKGSCVAGCSAATATSAGRAVTSYSAQETSPTIEDFGEAQLVTGLASVRLDPKFANVVEQRANYLVFITPEGDANTLYVTQKSMGGFTVRESHGGRSTIAFSYRIVAKPFGSHEARLPMVELPKLRASSPKQRAWHPGGAVPR